MSANKEAEQSVNLYQCSLVNKAFGSVPGLSVPFYGSTVCGPQSLEWVPATTAISPAALMVDEESKLGGVETHFHEKWIADPPNE